MDTEEVFLKIADKIGTSVQQLNELFVSVQKTKAIIRIMQVVVAIIYFGVAYNLIKSIESVFAFGVGFFRWSSS